VAAGAGERLPLRLARGQVHQRIEGDIDQAERAVEREGAHVALDEAHPVQQPRRRRLGPRGGEHRGRDVEAGHLVPGGGQRQQAPPGAAAELEDAAPGLHGGRESGVHRQVVLPVLVLQVVVARQPIEVGGQWPVASGQFRAFPTLDVSASTGFAC
jgi:hypothetical protein